MSRAREKPADALAARLIAVPRSSTRQRPQDTVAEAFAQAVPAAAAGLETLGTQYPLARATLATLADHSPFLWQMVRADPARALRLLGQSPEASLRKLISGAGEKVRVAAAEAEAMRILRAMRNEAALLVALADIGGVWTLAEVTGALTSVADAALNAAVDRLLAAAHAGGKLALPDPAHPGRGSGYFVLAMGKYGAGELNYSSDIDLVILFDRGAPLAGVEPAPFFVRLTRDLLRLLQERTADGYVARVDLRLRPDPGSTQIAISTEAALAYYEREGQTWERAALIKARVVGGDVALGERFLAELSPFIWRRYLDYGALAEVHAMKRQMHAFRGHGEIAVEGHNIKLGRGGIREVEFFVQTQQLIAGGRAPELRVRQTLAALDALVAGGWVDANARAELAEAYVYLRRLEHRLQMVSDEQTHTLPSGAALERFAHFFGAAGAADLSAELVGHLTRVQAHYAGLFEDAPPPGAIEGRFSFPPDADDRETLDTLARLGFKQPLRASAVIRQWLSGTVRALRPEAAQADLAAVLPALLAALGRTGNADAAVLTADRFFAKLPGAVRLLAALRTHPDLVQLLATILGAAPRLSEIIAEAPSALDGVIGPTFGETLAETELGRRLDVDLAGAINEEDALDRVRRFGREQIVLIGARVLSGTLAASRAGRAYSALADILIAALHRRIEDMFAEPYGRVRGGSSAVLALGKLGSREMTAGSDLDLILLYDFDAAHPHSDGPQSLHATEYYARLTKRLVSALTIRTNAGKLYDVDLRLRPSGRAGPLATSLASFSVYQREAAWTWEHMALTRARVVSAAPALRHRIEAEIAEVLRLHRDPETVARDVIEMRQAIAQEKGEGVRWDLKNAAGGSIDIEFINQYLILVHAAATPALLHPGTADALRAAQNNGLLTPADGEALRIAWTLYQDLTQVLRLCLPGAFDPKTAGQGVLTLLARAAGLPDFGTLDAHVIETQARVRQIFGRLLGPGR